MRHLINLIMFRTKKGEIMNSALFSYNKTSNNQVKHESIEDNQLIAMTEACAVFICKHCKSQFSNRNKLRIHSKIHILNKALKCGFTNCKKAFKTFKGLNLHLKRHPGFAYYKCKNCSESFYSLKESRHHNWKVHHIRRNNEIACRKRENCLANCTQQRRHVHDKSTLSNSKAIFTVDKIVASKQLDHQSQNTNLDTNEEVSSAQDLNEYFDFGAILQNISTFRSFNNENLFKDLGDVEVDQILRSFLSLTS